MKWISVKDRLPPVSFVESEEESDPYDAYPVLFFFPDPLNPEIVVGWYEVEDLSPFPGIPRFITWNGDGKHECVRGYTPTHWMPLPEPPDE